MHDFSAHCYPCRFIWQGRRPEPSLLLRLLPGCCCCAVDSLPESSDAGLQVYKAVRGGVQDVAIKIMHEADDEQLAQFEKVIR